MWLSRSREHIAHKQKGEKKLHNAEEQQKVVAASPRAIIIQSHSSVRDDRVCQPRYSAEL